MKAYDIENNEYGLGLGLGLGLQCTVMSIRGRFTFSPVNTPFLKYCIKFI